MNKKLITLIFVLFLLLISSVATIATNWQSSGTFSNGNVYFYFDQTGMWNLTGNTLTPNNSLAQNINITGYYYGNGGMLTNITTGAIADIWVNITGDTMTGNLSMGGNELTDVGKLIVEGLALMQNVTPDTDSLYSLGNSTYWWNELYVKSIFAESINASDIRTNSLNASQVNSTNIKASANISIDEFLVTKDGGGDLVIVLT